MYVSINFNLFTTSIKNLASITNFEGNFWCKFCLVNALRRSFYEYFRDFYNNGEKLRKTRVYTHLNMVSTIINCFFCSSVKNNHRDLAFSPIIYISIFKT